MTQPPQLQDAEITILHDVTYLPADREEKMDVYLPPENIPRPVPAVLLIHGGGWRIGDKASPRERSIGTNLAAQGYAVVSINYLLNVGEKDASGTMRQTRIGWPANFYDCKSALRFIRKENSRFGIDPGRIAVMGGSAGGHLAMLVGATAECEEMNGGGSYTGESNAVSCIINFYGVCDVSGKRAPIFAGATPEETEANVRAASPSTYFSSKTPPMLIAHGTGDRIVPVEMSQNLTRILREHGIDYWYIEISGAPHTFDLEPEQMDLRPVVLGFLKRHL